MAKKPSKKEALKWVQKHFPHRIDHYNEYVEETKKNHLSFEEFLKTNDEYGDFEKWMEEYHEYLKDPLRPESLEAYFLTEALQNLRGEWKDYKRFRSDPASDLREFAVKLNEGKIYGWHTDVCIEIIKRYDKRQRLVETQSLYDWFIDYAAESWMIDKYDYHIECTTKKPLTLFEWLKEEDERLFKIRNYFSDCHNPYAKVKCEICKKENIAFNLIVKKGLADRYRCRPCDNDQKELTCEEIADYLNNGYGEIHFEPVKGGRFNHHLIIDLNNGGCLQIQTQRQNDQSTVVVKYMDQRDIPKEWERGESESTSHYTALGVARAFSR